MTTVEKLSNDLYETLLRLKYPGLYEIAASKDIPEIVLARENRLFLLSWLLSQSPLVKQDEFSTKSDESKIVKWYSNMGICNNPDALMGRVPLQDQVDTLKNLLLFTKNVLCVDQSKGDSNRQSDVLDLYKKSMTETINIIPASLGLNKKLTYNEAVTYLNCCRETSDEKADFAENSPQKKNIDLSSNEDFGSAANNSSGTSHEFDRKECVEKFLEAFEAASSWSKCDEESTKVHEKSMDRCIDKINSNMAILKETFQSKQEISNRALMEPLEKREMPLDAPIEDIVIAIEEVSRLQIVE